MARAIAERASGRGKTGTLLARRGWKGLTMTARKTDLDASRANRALHSAGNGSASASIGCPERRATYRPSFDVLPWIGPRSPSSPARRPVFLQAREWPRPAVQKQRPSLRIVPDALDPEVGLDIGRRDRGAPE